MTNRQKIYIAIFGAPINSTNMGCQALTYSLINVLEKVAKKINKQFVYRIFGLKPSEYEKLHFCENLALEPEKIECYSDRKIWNFRPYVKHAVDNLKTIKALKECDVAIDMTAGDSFTDIYGDERFYHNTKYKQIIEKWNIPLILGPQTYGPFQDEKKKHIASEVIRNATTILSRDDISAALVKEMTGRNIQVINDLAFCLPYQKKDKIKCEKHKLGINISGLLVSEKHEETTKNFKLNTDYDALMDLILSYAVQKDKFDIYLIPHVQDDMPAIKKYAEKYGVQYVDMFKDPIAAKSFISQMDIFLGSRMHATIAAYTSGVLTIPVAYSRKFKGVFQVSRYSPCVNLMEVDTQTAAAEIIQYLENENMLVEEMEKSKEYREYAEKEMISAFENALSFLSR